MKTEIEVKFIDVDIDDVRKRLQNVSATLEHPMRLMRRQVFYLVGQDKGAYVRVRDEGNRVTMTFKRFADNSISGAKEAEVTVSNFDTAITILRESGMEPKSYQETRRETWLLDDAEVVIDEWPWLPPFIEIEGPSESSIEKVAEKLGFEWESAVFGGATEAYKASYSDLPEDFVMDDVAEIRFELPIPERLTKRL